MNNSNISYNCLTKENPCIYIPYNIYWRVVPEQHTINFMVLTCIFQYVSTYFRTLSAFPQGCTDNKILHSKQNQKQSTFCKEILFQSFYCKIPNVIQCFLFFLSVSSTVRQIIFMHWLILKYNFVIINETLNIYVNIKCIFKHVYTVHY